MRFLRLPYLRAPAIVLAVVAALITDGLTATAIGVGPPVATAETTPPGVYAYVATGDSVTVIDTTSHKITATVKVGPLTRYIAVTPDGTRAYATGGDRVFILDTAKNTIAASIAVGYWANCISLSRDGSRAYVSNDVGVVVINTTTNTVITTVPFPGSPAGAHCVALSPDGGHAYASVSPSGQAEHLAVIDTHTNKVVDAKPVTAWGYHLTVSRDNSRIYASGNRGYVEAVDAHTLAVVKEIPVSVYLPKAQGPWGLATAGHGNRVYAGCDQGLAVIDTRTNTVEFVVSLDQSYHGTFNGVAVHPDGKQVLVTSFYNNVVNVVDVVAKKVTATIPVGSSQGIAIGIVLHRTHRN